MEHKIICNELHLYTHLDESTKPDTDSNSTNPKEPKLLDKVRNALRTKHNKFRTEKSYLSWIKQFILFHNKRHPLEMDEVEINQFLTYLAVDRKVAASTQNSPHKIKNLNLMRRY